MSGAGSFCLGHNFYIRNIAVDWDTLRDELERLPQDFENSVPEVEEPMTFDEFTSNVQKVVEEFIDTRPECTLREVLPCRALASLLARNTVASLARHFHWTADEREEWQKNLERRVNKTCDDFWIEHWVPRFHSEASYKFIYSLKAQWPQNVISDYKEKIQCLSEAEMLDLACCALEYVFGNNRWDVFSAHLDNTYCDAGYILATGDGHAMPVPGVDEYDEIERAWRVIDVIKECLGEERIVSHCKPLLDAIAADRRAWPQQLHEILEEWPFNLIEE